MPTLSAAPACVSATSSLRSLAPLSGACLPASGTTAADRHQPGQDGKRDLLRRPAAQVEADRTLDLCDHVLRHALGAQRLEVVAGVPPAADQADEPRLSR